MDPRESPGASPRPEPRAGVPGLQAQVPTRPQRPGARPARRTFLAVLAAGVPVLGLTAACTDDSVDDDRPPVGVSPWSVSPSYGSGWDPAQWTAPIAAIGVENVRGFRVDSNGYEDIRAAGFAVTGVLQWTVPGQDRFPVEDLSGWRDYVESTVRAYPDVEQWEVWNEPPNFTDDPSPASYAKIVVAAWDVVKEVAPDVQVGLATKSTNTAWLREALVAGAAGHYDYVTLHPYERADNVVDGWEDPFLAAVPQLRAMLAEVDPDRAAVPVEFTEVGSPAGPRPGQEGSGNTPQTQATTLVKVMVMSVAQRVRRVSWYDPFDGDYAAGEAAYGLIGQDGVPRPSLGAYQNLIAALGGRPSFVGIVRPDADTFLSVFEAGKGTAALVGWSRGAGRTVDFEEAVRATSATTGEVTTTRSVPLTDDPSIVVVEARGDVRTLLDRARGAQEEQRPVVRTGTWDAGSGSAGLHVRGVTGPVLVDGRAVVQPIGSSVQVAVGPDFDFDASTVRVTVTVRGFRDEPGFNLKYDADAPLSTLDPAGQGVAGRGWTPVGTGEWRTLTWTMTDVRLAGMYGYNFELDSDTTAHSGYQLASIVLEVLASRTVPRPS